jgi:tetratricopeptide (TPR) repeat protein
MTCNGSLLAIGLGFLIATTSPLSLSAHGPLDEQIADATKEIALHPHDASLYLKRGELHHFHEDWPAALADFDTAQQIDPQFSIIDLYRSKTCLAAGEAHQAKKAIDRFFQHNPNLLEGFLTRARILVRLNEFERAATDYTLVVDKLDDPTPDIFVERARALESAGESRYHEALAGLDEGLRRIGPVVTLQLFAIELEVKLSRFDSALVRLETVAAQSPRKEKWLMRKAEIFIKAGRPDEAAQAYTDALDAIATLSPTRRQHKAVREMEGNIRSALENLSKK